MNTTQNTILDVAETLFAELGFDGASTRAIADKAGVNIAMLSYYFGAKPKLFIAVVERRIGEVKEVIKEVSTNEKDPLIRLKMFLERYVFIMFEHPAIPLMVTREMSIRQRPELTEAMTQAIVPVKAFIFQTIESGKRSGKFRMEIDSEMTVLTIVSTVVWPLLMQPLIKQLMSMSDKPDAEYIAVFRQKTIAHLNQLIDRLLVSY